MKKRGFTLIEMLVSGLILVIVMVLVAVLYTRAAKIRSTVTACNEVQLILAQMSDILIGGGGQPLEGLKSATKIYEIDNTDYKYITFGNCDGTGRKVKFKIFGDPDYSLHRQTYSISVTTYSITTSDPDLDVNNKIDIINSSTNNSRFCYYDKKEAETTTISDISKVVLCLVGKSTLGAIQKTVTLYSTAKISNLYKID